MPSGETATNQAAPGVAAAHPADLFARLHVDDRTVVSKLAEAMRLPPGSHAMPRTRAGVGVADAFLLLARLQIPDDDGAVAAARQGRLAVRGEQHRVQPAGVGVVDRLEQRPVLGVPQRPPTCPRSR